MTITFKYMPARGRCHEGAGVFTLFVAMLAALFGLPSEGRAFEPDTARAEYVSARIFAAGEEGLVVRGALEITPAPEWHTYWRSAGDSGMPPQIDWTRSDNVEGLTIRWPVPQRFEDFGLYTFGYDRAFVLPLEIRRSKNGPVVLDVDATIMVCNQICIPQKVELKLAIPEDFDPDPALVKAHERALEELPESGDLPGLKIETAVAGPEAFVVSVFAQHGVDEMDLFVEADDVALNQPPEITVETGDMRRALLRIPAPPDIDNLAEALRGHTVRLTLVNRGRAIEKRVEF